MGYGQNQQQSVITMPSLRSTADRLTALRLALLPVLWVLALLRLPVYLGIGVAIAGLTDMLDGYLARRSRQSTPFGSHFDSIADHLLSASMVIWLFWLRPHFFREQWPLLLLWAGIALSVLLVGWIKFRRFGDLHLYSAKAAAILGNLFGISLLIFGTYSPPVFYAVLAFCFVAAAETLIALLTCSKVDEHIGSILLPRRYR
jgi:phosphatidylglycerophosphate synthase